MHDGKLDGLMKHLTDITEHEKKFQKVADELIIVGVLQPVSPLGFDE